MEYKNLTMAFIAILTVVVIWLTYSHFEKMKELDFKIKELNIKETPKKTSSSW